MDIQQWTTVVLPWLVSLLCFVLQHEHWGQTINGLIAFVAMAMAAILTAILQGHIFGGSVFTDLIYVAGIMGLFLNESAFAPLAAYLRANLPPSSAPIMPRPPAPTPIVSPPSPPQEPPQGKL